MTGMTPIKYDDIRDGYYINEKGEIYSEITNRYLAGSSDKYGYRRVSLQRNSEPRQKTYKIHRLVRIIFDPVEDFESLTVDHLDGNKENNSLSNLDWCSDSENVKRAIKNELIYKSHRTIKDEEVITICEWLQKGYSPLMIAQKLYPDDIVKKTRIIQDIARKKNWKDVSCNYDFWVKYPEFNSKFWTIWDIEEVCQLIQDNKNKTNKELVNLLLQKHTISKDTAYNLIYGIRTKRKYTNVSQYYNF